MTSVNGKILLGGLAVGAIAVSAPAVAASEQPQEYHFEEQNLAVALRAVGRISGHQVMFESATVDGKRAPKLDGRYTVKEAIDLLLKDSSLVAIYREGAILIRRRSAPSGAVTAGSTATEDADRNIPDDVVVTGSHIRGASTPSPTIIRTQEQIRNTGQTSVGQYARSLPQSFNGGQNPGVTVGAGGIENENVSSSSSFNLRGLGSDATLVLLNGHRLSYDSGTQAIDVSAIPLDAVDRVEIVADGASAIYGSDAVGGVANIILKRDFKGFSTMARLGGSTDGGNTQRELAATAGAVWQSGGVLGTFDFAHDSAISARQRSYTAGLFPTATLVPYQKQYTGLVTGHQQLGPSLQLEFDATYRKRTSTTNVPLSVSQDFTALGLFKDSKAQSWSLSPKLTWNAAGDWRVALSGTAGQDNNEFQTDFYLSGSRFATFPGHFRNDIRLLEVGAEGTIIQLPGGAAKLAVGGGYRSNALDGYLATVMSEKTTVNRSFARSRDSYYGYGEIFLPIISADNEVSWISRLSASAAVRYENYPGMAHTATPKLGLVFAPSDDIDFTGSWGRSFKTPTLFQQYTGQAATLYPASELGPDFASTSTVLILTGGNTRLTPEKAETWTLGAVLHPVGMRGLRAGASYFHIRYDDRIAQAISSYVGVASNPAYQQLVELAPSAPSINAAVASSNIGLQNFTGSAFDPASVIAIVDDRYRNVAQQTLHGIDLAIDYEIVTNGAGTFNVSALGSFLHSERNVTATSSNVDLAGTIFNPPHWRGQGGATWFYDDLVVTTNVNVTGGLDDTRFDDERRVDGMTTFDLTVRYKMPSAIRPLAGVDLALSAQNLLNAKPNLIRTSQAYYPPYDSTNFSIIGRFISLSITKRW